MFEKVEVQNFHNLSIENIQTNHLPLTQSLSKEEKVLNIVFIRDPYAYLDYILYDYVTHKKSILFTEDIVTNMKKMRSESFLEWLQTLNFIPFYDPQTFQLDERKRLSVAVDNLESFDYVVPYEEMDLFLENVSLDMVIKKEKPVIFAPDIQKEHTLLQVFIDKDLKLYERSLELWELIKQNNFKPLGSLIKRKKTVESTEKQKKRLAIKKYKGVAGYITPKSIKGWVFHEENEESIMLEIYKNDDLLCTISADKTRKDLKNRQIHPTGECGFEVVFDKPTFKKGDHVEIKILPDEISLPLGKDIKNFLGI